MKKSNVGASSARPHFEESAKSPLPPRGHGARRATGGSLTSNRGITLIALIITIIIMLILVSVNISIALNTGLFDAAGKATQEQKKAQDAEQELGSGKVTIGGKKYESLENYVAGIERAPDIMEGRGTEAEPYTIDSIEALVQFAHSVTNGKTYAGEYVKLTRNLDFRSADSYLNATRTDYEEYGYTGELMTALTTGEGFIPIGREVRNNQDDAVYSFAGTFDGNGKIISNLYMNKEYGDENPNYECGLFGMNYGVIKNIGIEECDISVTTSKCWEVGSISGRNNGEINSCYASGEINVSSDYGGRAGGISGVVHGNIQNCYNKTSLVIDLSEATTTEIGGITGTGEGSVTSCYNNGLIVFDVETGTTLNSFIGGITGRINKQNNIMDCYNLSEINVTGKHSGIFLGGIFGYSLASIKNSYNSGNLVSNVTVTGTYNTVGGIAGLNYLSGTIESSKYLSSTATKGVGTNWGTADITSVDSIDDMPTVLEIVGDAFKEDTNNINDGYPLLNWQ